MSAQEKHTHSRQIAEQALEPRAVLTLSKRVTLLASHRGVYSI